MNQLAMALNLLLANLANKSLPRIIELGHVTGYALDGAIKIASKDLGTVYATIETTESGSRLQLTKAPKETVYPAPTTTL